MTRRCFPPRWSRFLWAVGSLLLSCDPSFAAGVLKLAEADEAALKAIDEVRASEPGLPRIDVLPVAVAAGPISLTLGRAVEIALANNAAMQTRRERVKLDALELVAIRRGYGPQWRAGITAVRREVGVTLDDSRTASQFTDSFQSLGVSQRLPFGGAVSLDFGGAFSQRDNTEGDYSPRAVVSLTQPLLRGAGRDLQQEPLTEAKRNLLYSLRGYKLASEDFVIGVINDFLLLQNLRAKIRSTEAKRDAFDHLIKRSRTFFELGRESEIETLRATQESLLVQQQLLNLELELKNRLELFAITLNLGSGASLEMAEFEIPFQKVEHESEEAVRLALLARPDLRSAAAAVEDSARRLKFAKRNLLPDLGINLKANAANTGVRTGSGVITEEYSAGLTLSLPLERSNERLAVYGALQTLSQNERALEMARATVSAGVRYGVNRIKSYENALEIQDSIVQASAKGVGLAGFRFERGQASNRNVIDANTILSNAVNARLDLRLAHYIATLQLRRDTGRLEAIPSGLFVQSN